MTVLIDKIAYQSALKAKHPYGKMALCFGAIFCCLFYNSFIVCALVLIAMIWLTVKRGRIAGRIYLTYLGIPLVFLIVGVCAILVDRSSSAVPFLLAAPIGNSYWGVSTASLYQGLLIFAKSIAAVSCLYYLIFNTPLCDILQTLRKLRLPTFFVELMELIYRFIFMLLETASRINRAQQSRLGYRDFGTGMHSMGILISRLFERSLYQSRKTMTALESRNYDGDLTVLPLEYRENQRDYLYMVLFFAVIMLIGTVERWLGL